MRALIVTLALLIAIPALAQTAKGWLGADVQDVTKAEADKLGWDTPHGAKIGVVASGSPAEKAGLRTGDIILSVDRMVVDTSAEVDAAIAAKHAGAEVRLQVLSGGRERYVQVTLAQRAMPRPAEASAIPHLMLDTGGHMALIKGLAFTADNKLLVSAGEDKVIRVWDLQSGKTVRTIRGAVGLGDEGKIFAMALSPDAHWLAVGGFLAQSRGSVGDIRLYDFTTGNLVALLRGHSDIVNDVVFSPDGRKLISGSFDKTAILWDINKRSLIYRLRAHGGTVGAVGFMPDGTRVVTASDDRTLKVWSVSEGREITTLSGHTDSVFRLAVSPDGTVASGSDDGEIRLWDGKSPRYLRTLAKLNGQIGPLRFSPDGKWLFSGCGYGDCAPLVVRVWQVASGKEIRRYTKHKSSVLAIALSADGRLVATGGGDQDIHVWETASGESRRVLAGTGSPVLGVAFSPDGRIAWGTKDKASIEYELRLPNGTRGLGRPERVDGGNRGFARALVTHNGFTLAHREGGAYRYSAILDVKKDGQTQTSIERAPAQGYAHISYSFSPDGRLIISGGGNGVLNAYDLTGRLLGELVGHEGDIWDVAPSPDGRFLVSGSQDQTIRLWNLKTRKLIVTLFHGSDREWVMWTPQGYYTGSPGADKLVGWQINKGPEQAADYVGADQLRQHLNRPDIVEKAIVLASAEQAVREAPGTTFQLSDLMARPVPRFRIVPPAPGAVERGGRALVKIAIDATPDPIKAIRVQVNGRQVEEQIPDIGSGGFKAGEQMLDVPLSNGRNDVRIELTNAIGTKAETLTLIHESQGALDKRGTLFILAIGVNKYPGLGKSCGDNGTFSCDLSFSSADATALVAAVEKRVGPAHTNVVKRILVNGAGASAEPTAANIIDALDLLKQAKEVDTVLLFIAGHGVNDGPSYRFLATNAERVGDSFRGTTVVPWQILQEAMETAKGRRVLFIDTCHSGNAYNQRLGNAAYHANIIAYTAARFDQEALEDPKLGHGLFTYAVVEALSGKGTLEAKRQVSTKELADYVVKRVDELAKSLKGEQEPQYFKGRDAQDYVLARW